MDMKPIAVTGLTTLGIGISYVHAINAGVFISSLFLGPIIFFTKDGFNCMFKDDNQDTNICTQIKIDLSNIASDIAILGEGLGLIGVTGLSAYLANAGYDFVIQS